MPEHVRRNGSSAQAGFARQFLQLLRKSLPRQMPLPRARGKQPRRLSVRASYFRKRASVCLKGRKRFDGQRDQTLSPAFSLYDQDPLAANKRGARQRYKLAHTQARCIKDLHQAVQPERLELFCFARALDARLCCHQERVDVLDAENLRQRPRRLRAFNRCRRIVAAHAVCVEKAKELAQSRQLSCPG